MGQCSIVRCEVELRLQVTEKMEATIKVLLTDI